MNKKDKILFTILLFALAGVIIGLLFALGY